MGGVPTDLFDCARVNSYLEAYLLDRVPPPERRGMRLHIHRCPACFAKVTARDPLQLFAPLADQKRGEPGSGPQVWESFWDDIAEGVRKEESLGAMPRLVRWVSARPALLAAAAAAVIVAVGVVWLRPAGELRGPEPPAIPVMAGAGVPPAPESGGMPLPPVVEAVRTPDARPVTVYSMAYEVPGAGSTQAQLVLIVDGGLEL